MPFQRHSISPIKQMRWEDIGLRLSHVAPELLLSISDIRANPSKAQLEQAATVARYTASKLAEPEKSLALTLAEELAECAA